MLFDLRGRGRRRTVQVIYASLAILLGGGLVLFGIGGDVQGGLVDAFTGGGGGENDVLEDDVEKAEERVRANRQDATAWAELAEAKANLAAQSEGVSETGLYSGESRRIALEATRAWDQHVKLAEDAPDDGVARVIVNAYASLGDQRKGFDTWNQVVDAKKNPDSSDFQFLAELAILTGDPSLNRLADRAIARTLELAKEEGDSKEQIAETRAGFDTLKARVAQQQQAQQGGAGAAPQTPAQP